VYVRACEASFMGKQWYVVLLYREIHVVTPNIFKILTNIIFNTILRELKTEYNLMQYISDCTAGELSW